jgi:thioesterase domain-containing protein
VIADRQDGRRGGPVVFVGHSCGGRSALFAAQELGTAGIDVSLIVCLDVTLPPPVPANVRRAINLRRTRRRLYPAMPLVAGPGAATIIEDLDLDAPNSPIEPGWICHANITSRPRVREYVVGRVLEVMNPI